MYMNTREWDVLDILIRENYVNQRSIAEASGHSLGIVNRAIKNLVENGYLNEYMKPTEKALCLLEQGKPKRGIILAAGPGMRMVPINTQTPKALLEVKGEPLIERLIKQLHEVGITEILVIVGFMKEAFEYLIDEYGVELVVNPSYLTKNNMHSLGLVKQKLANAYIIPCDLWCEKNPFHSWEAYSWYMVSDRMELESGVKVNRKMELACVGDTTPGNAMLGIAYLMPEQADEVERKLNKWSTDARRDGDFWEETLYEKDRMILQAKVVSEDAVVEINTYEQLRELDENSNQLKSDAIDIIAGALKVTRNAVHDITVLKKGMTNRSFLFRCEGKRYIMRIPGEGTDQLINRKEEADVYATLAGKNICDDVAYMNPDNGYKITAFLEGARVCDPENVEDLQDCMRKLREFHGEELKVEHEFNIFKQIDFYESLWAGEPSVYRDYKKTKENVLTLKDYIDAQVTEKVLTHIDAVPDNFLFVEKDGKREIRLIDWEYAGMQDPHVDIAMFCIYSLYNRQQVDQLIDIYFENDCPVSTRIKIYCYIACCGLLWSNWCEYKRSLGVEFGEYSLRQYRYAKEYYRIVQNELAKMEE